MRESDWSRANLLRSDWLGPGVASMTTNNSFKREKGWVGKFFYFGAFLKLLFADQRLF